MDQVPDSSAPEPHQVAGTGGGEAAPESGPESRPVSRSPIDFESTGVETVDRVLAEVAAIGDRPVGEHVEVFERAHEQLRRALDAQTDPADGGQGA